MAPYILYFIYYFTSITMVHYLLETRHIDFCIRFLRCGNDSLILTKPIPGGEQVEQIELAQLYWYGLIRKSD